MLNFNKMLMGKKLQISIMVIIIPAFLILILISSLLANAVIKEIVLREVTQTAYRYAHSTQVELEESLTLARALAQSFAAQKDNNSISRSEINVILENALNDNEKILGVWSIWEPNALDGNDQAHMNQPGADATGRFVPYWNRIGGVHLESCMDYDKESPQSDYYKRPFNEKKKL